MSTVIVKRISEVEFSQKSKKTGASSQNSEMSFRLYYNLTERFLAKQAMSANRHSNPEQLMIRT